MGAADGAVTLAGVKACHGRTILTPDGEGKRPMDRYERMEHDGEQDDAPFRGGSTEQRDGFLDEHARNTPAQDADFWARYGKANAALHMPDADLMAWTGLLVEGRVFASREILAGYLLNCRRIDLGRALAMSERHAVERVVATVWASWTRDAAVA